MIQFLRQIILNDFWLKLFSLALAVLIWLIVDSFSRNRQRPVVGGNLQVLTEAQRTIRDLPVVVLSSASDVRSFRVAPSKVEVTVQGDSRLLDTLAPRDIHALVDVTGIEAAHDLKKRIDVATPPGVKVLSVDPSDVQVVFPPRE